MDTPSHFAMGRSLGAWLAEEGIPGLTGVDTRRLTRHLRENGTMYGWLIPGDGSDEEEREEEGRGERGAKRGGREGRGEERGFCVKERGGGR